MSDKERTIWVVYNCLLSDYQFKKPHSLLDDPPPEAEDCDCGIEEEHFGIMTGIKAESQAGSPAI